MIAVALWLLAASAHAQSEPAVALVLEGPWASELGAEVRADLRASLRERGLSLIDADEHPDRVLATIRIVAPDLDRPVAHVEIDDRVNQKRVERDVGLGREPVDTWSVVIAAAADELLRAAWLELTMEDAPPPAFEPPPEVEAAARSSIAPTGPRDGAFGVTLGGALEGYTEGGVLAGGDLTGTFFVHELIGVELGLVVRGLVPGAGALGSLDALAIGGDVGARISLLGRGGLARLELLAALRALAVDLRPTPAPESIASASTVPLVVLRGGFRAALALDGPIHVGLVVFAGAPLSGVRAVDANGDVLGGLSGVELGARVEVSLWP